MQNRSKEIALKFVNKYRFEIAVFFAFLLLALLFYWPMLKGMLPGTGGDAYQGAWELWWVPYALFTLHTSPYYTHYLFYPEGANLITQTLAPIAGIVSAPLQAFGLNAAMSFVFFLGFALSGVFAYALAYYLTKNKLASFLAGFIFAFSPIHTVQSLGHLQYINIEFIPLFLLFFLEMINEKKQKYALYSAISFVLLTFMGDIEQALMTSVLIFLVLVYMLAVKHERQKIANKRFIALFFEMIVLTFVIGSPAFLTIMHGINSETLATVNAQAGLQYNELYSADLLSFFVPSLDNAILRGAALANIDIFKGDPAETTTYVGYTVIFVVAYALYADYKKEKMKNTGLFAFASLFLLWLTIGPYLWISGPMPTAIPGIYLLYSKLPLFNVLREPGRFDVAAELMLAVLFAYGISDIQKEAKNYGKYVMPIAFILLFIEYNAIPMSQAMVNSEYSTAHIPKAYYEIGEIKSPFTMLVLPVLPNTNSSTPNLYPGIAEYYQTAFKKQMIGGYVTRENTSQAFSVENIPLTASSYYLELGQGLVYASPINENYTNATKLLLGLYNVSFIAIIRQAYTYSELENITSYLASQFGAPVYESNTTIVFSTVKALSNMSIGITAYAPVLAGSITSVWQPGWFLCSGVSGIGCNATFQSMWWGANPAFIEIFSPYRTQQRLQVKFSAMAYQTVANEYVYFDNFLVQKLALDPNPLNFTLNITAQPGINPLVFVPSGTYQNFGIRNITITKLTNTTKTNTTKPTAANSTT